MAKINMYFNPISKYFSKASWLLRGFQVLFLIILLFQTGIPSPSRAMNDHTSWYKPVNISNSDTSSDYPSIVADSSGVLHVVWSETYLDGTSYIVYSRFDGETWTNPNEIVTSPSSHIVNPPSLAIDSTGLLHLSWSGDGTIYYSSAYAKDAYSSTNWSPPIGLEFNQNYVGDPQILADGNDRLHLIYAIAVGENSGIFYTTSEDYGEHWIEPVMVYKNTRNNQMVDVPKLAFSSDGLIYAVWAKTNYPETFPPQGILFSRSTDQGKTWSNPVILLEGPYSDPYILVRKDHELHLVFSGTNPDRFKFHLWTIDGGVTWSTLKRIDSVGGFQGYATLIIDSDFNLHWLTVASVFSMNNDSLIAFHWVDEQWSDEEVILSNVVTMQNPANVSACIAAGNNLHVVVQAPLPSTLYDTGYQNDIFYSALVLDSSPVDLVPLPNKEYIQSSINETETTLSPVSLPTRISDTDTQQPSYLQLPILLGVGISFLFLFLYIFLFRFFNRRV